MSQVVWLRRCRRRSSRRRSTSWWSTTCRKSTSSSARILEELGQNIVSARSGQEALRYILEQEFAVILLDVNMPDIDGLETASLIRQYKKSAQTPIVFITAYVDEVQAKRGYALGAVDYIPSPVVPEVLRSKVRVFVELFRMNRQLQVQAAAARSPGALRGGTRGRGRCDPSGRLPVRSQPACCRARSNIDDTIKALFDVACPCWPTRPCWASASADGGAAAHRNASRAGRRTHLTPCRRACATCSTQVLENKQFDLWRDGEQAAADLPAAGGRTCPGRA